jgi:heme-degrading monooxygenase HmoA
MAGFAPLPQPPYYAVIFASQRGTGDKGYKNMAESMLEIAAQQPGFLGVETARGESGFGITVSYWENEAAIAAWKAEFRHRVAQQQGKAVWYEDYIIRVAKVERAYAKG